VEWPIRDSAELSDARVRVTLAHMGEDRRRVEVVQG
jgi:tRNA A37 threonylcarbamoyladenosine biosynthesis protein TsaE